MAKVLLIEPEKCVGCKVCELVCAYGSDEEFNPGKSKIKSFSFPFELIFIPVNCLHCTESYCLDACPAGAISRNAETGAVTVNEERCIGCKMCVMSCPFGNMGYNGEIAAKCNLCEGEPRCVSFCTGEALKYVEADDFILARKREAAEKWKKSIQGS